MSATVTAVSFSNAHTFSKTLQPSINLLEGLGVEGDAHAGKTVKHRSRVAKDPYQPNLRQVHLIAAERHDELVAKGFNVGPGIMGENITTSGIDLLALPRGARLTFPSGAEIEITGLRNPCKQLNDYQAGLMNAVLDRTETGVLIRRCGVMAIVLRSGKITPNDVINVQLPTKPHTPLDRV